MEVGVDPHSSRKLLPGLLGPPDSLEDFSQLVVGHIIVGAEPETATVKSDGLFGIPGRLTLLKVSEGAVAVLPLLLLPLPGRKELLDLLTLDLDLLLLEADLLVPFADEFRCTRRKEEYQATGNSRKMEPLFSVARPLTAWPAHLALANRES